MTTTTVSIEHIALDDKGIARVGGTRSKVSQIVCDTRNGLSPDEIHEAYPHLSLAQIYAALSYYYDHKTEIDTQIEESLKQYNELRANASSQPTRAELVERLRAKTGEASAQ